ncbi:unnamed protein product [Cylicocyclus nassatus]|uniref:Uncharacterized protein n=1 Tax=Cylicocyclus nassatus TaxID=53992 RepID=A0AA36MF27_CYLNA|nr:unnamed protein product [Cylicocyclus nassatus]
MLVTVVLIALVTLSFTKSQSPQSNEESNSRQLDFWRNYLNTLSSKYDDALQEQNPIKHDVKRCRWKLCGTGRMRFI